MNQLLHTPEGVRDIYNDECERKIILEERLLTVLKSYGYHPIQTPTFEFFDIFGKGASFMGTMLMGITTQIFHTSKAGVVAIAVMFAIGFLIFVLQGKTEKTSYSVGICR